MELIALLVIGATALPHGLVSEMDEMRIDAMRVAARGGHLSSNIHLKLDSGRHAETEDRTELDVVADEVISSLCPGGAHRRLFPHAGKHERKHISHGLHLWYQVRCLEEGVPRNATADFSPALHTVDVIEHFLTSRTPARDQVELVEPENAVLNAAGTVPVHKQEASGQEAAFEAIDVFGAWDVAIGSPNVVVQVVDTGVDVTHVDLDGAIWTNRDEIPGNGIDDDDNGYVDDVHGWNFVADAGAPLIGGRENTERMIHGSHCAGTIAAESDNCEGIAGIAGGWNGDDCDGSRRPGRGHRGARIMIAVTFSDEGSGGFAEAIVYAADNGAHISSNSWTYAVPGVYDTAIVAAIEYFNAANGVCVFAAGNGNSNWPYYPSYSDQVVAVAAVDDDGRRYERSNFGDWIDLAAPGVDILSTAFDDQYALLSGTSMACPHVSGVLALGKSISRSLARDELLSCLYSTSTSLETRNDVPLGAGLVNASAFVACVATASAVVPDFSSIDPFIPQIGSALRRTPEPTSAPPPPGEQTHSNNNLVPCRLRRGHPAACAP